MRFVERQNGKIVGDYTGFVEGIAEEEMPEDSPEFMAYLNPPPQVPDRVTSRQFKLQLLADGLLDAVEGWIGTQDRAIQIAYANSGTFVRNEPMLQAGFAALNLSEEQGDAFFTAAALL